MKRILFLIAFLFPSIVFAQAAKQNEAQAVLYPTALQSGPNVGVDRYGYHFVNAQYAPSGNLWSACSSAETTTSARAVKNAAGAGVRIYVNSISCSNTATVASTISFHDGSTTLYGGAISNSTLAGVASYQVTLPAPLRTSANAPINFQMGTTATNTICCMSGFTASY